MCDAALWRNNGSHHRAMTQRAMAKRGRVPHNNRVRWHSMSLVACLVLLLSSDCRSCVSQSGP